MRMILLKTPRLSPESFSFTDPFIHLLPSRGQRNPSGPSAHRPPPRPRAPEGRDLLTLSAPSFDLDFVTPWNWSVMCSSGAHTPPLACIPEAPASASGLRLERAKVSCPVRGGGWRLTCRQAGMAVAPARSTTSASFAAGSNMHHPPLPGVT